jgi:Holliday junction resolvase RusA-like endonuclease
VTVHIGGKPVAHTFQVTVPGIPKAQGRPRAFRLGDGIRMYDPETSRDWKRTVLDRVATAWGDRGAPIEGPVLIELHFDLPRPKSLPKRVLHHTKKPDVDNLAKAVKDAIKGIVYRDDSQVVSLRVAKSYSVVTGVQIYVASMEG